MGAQAFIPRSMNSGAESTPRAARSRGAEAQALLQFALALFLLLSLLTLRLDPSDPTVHGADWMGSVGAWVAGLLALGFGLGAWLVPLELVLIGLPLFRGYRAPQLSLRLAGDLVILVLVSSLVQVAWPELLVFGEGLPGGNVGLFFGELLRGLFSAPGSFLVGATSIGLILIGRASFSFFELCERIVNGVQRLLLALRAASARVWAAWTEARQLRRAQTESLQNAPTIETPSPDSVILHHLTEESPWDLEASPESPPLAIHETLRQSIDTESRLEEAFEVEERAPVSVQTREVQTREPRLVVAPEIERNEAPRSTLDGFWGGLMDDEERAELPPEGADDESLDERPVSSAGLVEGGRGASAFSQEEASPTPASPELAPAVQSSPAEPFIVDTKPQQEVRASRALSKKRKVDDFELPSTSLLDTKSGDEKVVSRESLLRDAALLEKTLLDYGVTGQVEEIHPGPTVTTFEFAPRAGTKVSKVAGLADDLALGLSRKVRIIAPIPGKNRIGFELPNEERVPVNLRELVEDERFLALGKKAPLPVVMGRDIVGAPFYADLASMPHVIVAGATGAGKSVGLNVMLSSLLFCRTPEELRLLMIDPKVVELAPFDRIPHLLLPVVTDMKQAATALRWAVDEMERRYQLFADAGTKNITTYNRYVERVLAGDVEAPPVAEVDAVGPSGEVVSVPAARDGFEGHQLPEKLPFIVIVVDEFADLMMQQGKEVEGSVARLAQKARAAGMHVILATQRPSVDVITGMIKANFPSRIAFRVAQKVDSRTILDEQGAEVLLGRGDMLVKLNGATDTLRVQCPFVSEEEVSALTDHLRAQSEPRYQESILDEPDEAEAEVADEKEDNRFEEAVLIVRETQRCSTSWLQRKMTIGYNRAAKIVEMMERRGYVGPPNGSRDREVLLPPG